jgi:type IV pilus assembly protein PilF
MSLAPCTDGDRRAASRGSRARSIGHRTSRWIHALAVASVGFAAVASAMGAGGCASRRAASEGTDPGAPEVSPADKHYDVAVGSFHNGMFEDAKFQLERALAADPKHADSYYLKGVLLLNEGRTIVDALEIDRCLTDASAGQQRERADALHREAAAAFTKAIEHYPEGAAGRGRARNSLAVVDLFFHDDGRAIQHAEAALREQFYTDRYSALANLGWAFYQQGDLVRATTELRQSVLINPDYCVGRYRLAQVYLDQGLPEQAIEQAQAVMEDARCPIQDAHRIYAVANMRLHQPDLAQGAFRSCVDLAPRSCLAEDCARFVDPDASAVSPPMARAAVAEDETAGH